MITIVGGIAGGLGLFFMGMKLLSEHLRLLSNRRLRQSAARWTRNRWTGLAWGAIAGAVTQTMPALTFLTVGMLRSGLLSVRRAFPILLGGNIGAVLLLLVVMLDIKMAVLYVLGVSQMTAMISTKNNRTARYQTMAAALFGMGMMILGFLLLKDSVSPLADYPWFREIVAWADRSLFLCLVGGTLLSVAMQSAGVVKVTSISMAAAGLLGIDQILMLNLGACLGSSAALWLLTLNLTGCSRQVAMYQVLFNCVSVAVFVPLLIVEAYFDVPLFKAAVLSIDLPLAQRLALFAVFVELSNCAFQLTVLGPAARLIARWWPATEAETLSKPWYVHDRALEDAASSLRLADREQRRLLEILSRCLDTVRQGTELGALREAAKAVLTRIEEFLDDLAEHYPDQSIDDHVSMLTRQRLLFWLDERVLELCEVLHTMPRRAELEDWRMGLVEGIDAVLLVLQDILSSGDEESWPLTMQLVNSRGELMRKTRSTYLGDGSSLSAEQRTSVLRLTSITEHIFLLLSRLAHEYQRYAADNAAGQTPDSEVPAAETMASPSGRSLREDTALPALSAGSAARM